MKRTVLLFTFALLVLAARAQAADFSFGIDGADSVEGSAGSNVTWEGSIVVSSSEAGLGGYSFAASASSGDVDFCIVTEGTSPYFTGQKNNLWQDQLVGLTGCDPESFNPTQQCETTLAFPNTVFVIQDDSGGCTSGTAAAQIGDPSANVPGPADNGGIRGWIDATIATVGAPDLPALDRFRVLNISLDIVVPASPGTITLAFVGAGLAGPGQQVRNTVSLNGTQDVSNTETLEISVAPTPFIVNFGIDMPDSITSVSGNPGSTAGGSISITSDGDGEGVAAAAFSVGLSGSGADIVGASTSQDLLDNLSDVSSLAFESFHFSGNSGGVDASAVFSDEGDADCDVTDGAAQGSGLVVGQVFALELTGSGQTLPAQGTVSAVDFDVQGSADLADDGGSVTASFVDCLQGPGSKIKNSVTILGRTVQPRETGSDSTSISVVQSGQFIRCDPNGDLKNDIADVVFIIQMIVRTASAPASFCKDSADCDSSGAKGDIADAMFAATYQFQGGAAPAAPFGSGAGACGIDPNTNPEDCPPASHGCEAP